MSTYLERLGRDPNGRVSSLPVLKNCNWQPETSGRWIHIAGYEYHVGLKPVGRAHQTWAKGLLSMGTRVGVLDEEGVMSYYVFETLK